jgi:trehalose synthase
VHSVETTAIDPARLQVHIGPERTARLAEVGLRVGRRLAGRTVWNVNSTATGGGVAEMLAQLVGYGLGAGVDTRWVVMEGDPAFFDVTKRLHNRLHGQRGDGGPLGAAESAAYAEATARAASELKRQARRGDLVVLHDPQTAGMAQAMTEHGCGVIWRCHVGADAKNDDTDDGWAFLRPFLKPAHHLVFSRKAYVPDGIEMPAVTIVPPAIDPFSTKNAELDAVETRAILTAAGLLDDPSAGAPTFRRGDGSCGRIQRRATVIGEGRLPTPEDKLVVQVSRWDRLKDMLGVMRGFAQHADGARLMLVGPSVEGVSDDPEGRAVWTECSKVYATLPVAAQQRITLGSLPMEDVDENAAMVNAVQRHAAIVVQKSLAEGFGLTVAEAMWKARPVVASAVGGIQDQVVDGRTGLLLQDPSDLAAFGAVLDQLLADPSAAQRCGAAAREQVRMHFLPDRQLIDWANVLTAVDGALAR